GSRAAWSADDLRRRVGIRRDRAARPHDHVLDDVTDYDDRAHAMSAATAALERTAAMFASRLAPPVAARMWSSRNGVTGLPRTPAASAARRPSASARSW